MHSQTGSMTTTTTTTKTTTMAYTAVPLPASPTLTNPDMILPYGEYDSTLSPPHGTYRSGSPNEDWDTNPATMQFSIGTAHAHMGMGTPTTPIIYGNGTMLSDIGEVTEAESTPGRKLPGPAERRMLKQQQQQNQPLRSSPTIGYEAVMKRAKVGTHQRKISIESTSTVTSEPQQAELFKDFDDSASVGDSVFQGDDEESVAESVADSYVEGVIASETKRLNQTGSINDMEEDRNSSAALSRRAEQILLNAKKRLNNMEGNLTRARSSLYTTPTGSLSSIHSSSPLTRSTPSPQDSARLISSLSVPPSRHRQLNTPLESPASSPGHARVFSENSIVSVRGAFPVRSASAAARYMNRGVPDAAQPSPPLSYPSDTTHADSRAGSRGGYSSSLSKTSSPHGTTLEPLSEHNATPDFDTDRASMRSAMDDHLGLGGEHRLTRSTSTMQMRDLRDQMQDLKGRLSVLRDRARDDTMKRRSLQSLRTPSPFTAAEQWYASSKNYGNSPPLSADAGVAQAPWNDDNSEGIAIKEDIPGRDETCSPNYTESDVTSVYEDVMDDQGTNGNPGHAEMVGVDEEYDTAAEGGEGQDFEGEFVDDYTDEMVDREEVDDYESDASMYHDTVANQISHEDREDAFDYEHFFLHSAMGTMSQHRRSRRDSGASFSSEDSVETTRGPPALPVANDNPRASLGHLRSESTDSVSTMATFATATEGTSSEDGDAEDETADFSVQDVVEPEQRTTTPVTAKRSTFGSSVHNLPEIAPATVTRRHSTGDDQEKERNGTGVHRPSVASFESFISTGTTRSFPLVNKPKNQESKTSLPDIKPKESEPSLISNSTTLAETGERLQQPSPVHMLAREDQILVERLVASLGKCVLGLQESGRASYEGRVWRRRLDAARRVLEGQEGAV